MNQEVIEFRIASAKASIYLMTALILCCVGCAAAAQGTVTTALVGFWVYGLGIVILSMASAMIKDGYSRRFWKHFKDLDDPPTREWCERLESRGSFSVSESDVMIPDGGDEK